jgi:hypothetical protein
MRSIISACPGGLSQQHSEKAVKTMIKSTRQEALVDRTRSFRRSFTPFLPSSGDFDPDDDHHTGFEESIGAINRDANGDTLLDFGEIPGGGEEGKF